MIRMTAIRPLLVIFIVLALFYSCSDDGDPRQAVKRVYGEPDEIIKGEFGGLKMERWVFARKDINRAYDFSRTSDACGGSGKWYVDRMYYANYIGYTLYLPPEVDHTPVTQAVLGQRVTVSANVTDDEFLYDVTLNYRVLGQEEYVSVQMTTNPGENDVFYGEIPAVAVTEAGFEYYIRADDDAHSTWMPAKDKTYLVTVVPAAEKSATGPIEHSPRFVPPPLRSDAGRTGISPLTP